MRRSRQSFAELVKQAVDNNECFYCGFDQHLSTDIQCPVVGIGDIVDNQLLLEMYGTLEAALEVYGLAPKSPNDSRD